MATEEFSKLLQRLGKRCSEGANLNEREVIDLFIEQSFFTALSHGAIGEDLRPVQTVPGNLSEHALPFVIA